MNLSSALRACVVQAATTKREHVQVAILERYLDTFGPFLKHCTSILGRVRLQICVSFIRLVQEADASLLCYAKDIVGTMSQLQSEG